MKERIAHLLTQKKLSPAEFADLIGVQRSSVSHVLNGRNNPSAAFLQKILTAFPSVSPRWLMLGDETPPITEPVSAPEQTLFEPERRQPIEIVPERTSPFNATEPSLSQQKQRPVQTPVHEVAQPLPEEEIQQVIATEPKKIERILVFYADKTFSEYNPAH